MEYQIKPAIMGKPLSFSNVEAFKEFLYFRGVNSYLELRESGFENPIVIYPYDRRLPNQKCHSKGFKKIFSENNKSYASGKNAIAYGFGARAKGDNSIAIGNMAWAIGDNLKSIGDNTILNNNIAHSGEHEIAMTVSTSSNKYDKIYKLLNVTSMGWEDIHD